MREAKERWNRREREKKGEGKKNGIVHRMVDRDNDRG